MSFSVHNPQSGMEYSGHTLTSLFAQRRNLVNPAYWGMLKEIVRFNRLAKQALNETDVNATLQTFLDQHHFSVFFARHYICRWARPYGHLHFRRCAVFHWRCSYGSLSTMACWISGIDRNGMWCRAIARIHSCHAGEAGRSSEIAPQFTCSAGYSLRQRRQNTIGRINTDI